MTDTPTTVLEFTIDAELKRTGDEILAARGITPEEAITLLYEATVQLGHLPWGLQAQDD